MPVLVEETVAVDIALIVTVPRACAAAYADAGEDQVPDPTDVEEDAADAIEENVAVPTACIAADPSWKSPRAENVTVDTAVALPVADPGAL